MTGRLVDARSAADYLGIHVNSLKRWSDAGLLAYYRINPRGDRRYDPADLDRFLADRRVYDGPPGEQMEEWGK